MFKQVDSKDTVLILVASILSFSLIFLHTGSVFITVSGIFAIFLSIPLTLVFYNLVFRIEFMGNHLMLAGFIVYVHGSNCIILFHNQWKDSILIRDYKSEPILRISLATRKTFKVSAISSLTSAAIYASLGFNNVSPYASFGIFGAMVLPLTTLHMFLILPYIYFSFEKTFIRKHNCFIIFRICLHKIRPSKFRSKYGRKKYMLDPMAFNNCKRSPPLFSKTL